jgi:cephalosporin hydroxylase
MIRSMGKRLVLRAQRLIIDLFHRLYYETGRRGGTWTDTHWFGVQVEKCPLDLWIYQEIIYECRPHVIIETGTLDGGSGLYLAALCDLLNQGRVITIDVDERERPSHPRITYVAGSSSDPAVVKQVRAMIRPREEVMVILDSDHSRDHVLSELRAYASVVTLGQYLIVEDTNVNAHPVSRNYGPGPYEAVHEFLQEQRGFIIDQRREKLLLTFNPDGFLRRVHDA